MEKACFIGKELFTDREKLKRLLSETVALLRGKGVKHFLLGGSGEFTEIAWEVILEEKKKNPLINATQILPCPESAYGFTGEAPCGKTERIEKGANELIFLTPTYKEDCVFLRDLRLISESKYVVYHLPKESALKEYLRGGNRIHFNLTV